MSLFSVLLIVMSILLAWACLFSGEYLTQRLTKWLMPAIESAWGESKFGKLAVVVGAANVAPVDINNERFRIELVCHVLAVVGLIVSAPVAVAMFLVGGLRAYFVAWNHVAQLGFVS